MLEAKQWVSPRHLVKHGRSTFQFVFVNNRIQYLEFHVVIVAQHVVFLQITFVNARSRVSSHDHSAHECFNTFNGASSADRYVSNCM